jgi:hypothetical protein
MDTFLKANIVHLWTFIVNSDSDPLREELQKSFLDKQTIANSIRPFHCSPIEKEYWHDKISRNWRSPGTNDTSSTNVPTTKQLNHKAPWASSEVINTMANIEWTIQIICKITSILGKHGINIAITM